MCPICRSEDHEVVYDLTAVQSAEDVPGRVARCRSCAMWFKLLSEPGAMPKEYPGEYGEAELAQSYLASRRARDLFRDALAHIEVGTGAARPRLLDIGAAQGTLLEEASRLGFAAEGIDHSETNVRAARERALAVSLGEAEDLDVDGEFDAITMMDIIEHLNDPLRVLRAAHRALKPGGELVVYTPNHRAAVVVLARILHRLRVRYPVREIFGRNHLCFFDDLSLPAALHRSGFQVRLLRLFPYDPTRPGQHVSPVNLLAIAAAEWLGRPFHRVFRMLVYARKLGPPTAGESGASHPA